LRYSSGCAARWLGYCIRACGRIDLSEWSANSDGLAFLDQHFGNFSRGGRGDFDVDFVGSDFDERLTGLYEITGLLAPARDRTFGDRFPHLGEYDLDQRLLH
jgi:hypothetical protein